MAWVVGTVASVVGTVVGAVVGTVSGSVTGTVGVSVATAAAASVSSAARVSDASVSFVSSVSLGARLAATVEASKLPIRMLSRPPKLLTSWETASWGQGLLPG